MAGHLKNQLNFLEEQGIITITTREKEYETGIKECIQKVKRTRKIPQKKKQCLGRKADGKQCGNGTNGEFCGIHARVNTKGTLCNHPDCFSFNRPHQYAWEHNGRVDKEAPTWFHCKPCGGETPGPESKSPTILEIVTTSVNAIESGEVYTCPVKINPPAPAIQVAPRTNPPPLSITERVGILETQLYSEINSGCLMNRIKHLEKDILGAAVVKGGKLANRVMLLEESV